MTASPKPAAASPLAIEHGVSLARLHSDPRNARTHGERNMQAIIASLKEHGQVEPLVVQRSSGRIVGGNGRFEAMRLLGWQSCLVAWVDIDDLAATKLGITLNRSAELAEWDLDTLDALLADLEADNVDIADLGFTADDLDALLGQAEAPSDPDDDLAPEVPANPITRLGDVWVLGKHRLMCGDSASGSDMATLMRKDKAGLLFTDPPYNVAQQGMPSGSDLRKSYKNLGNSAWDKGFDFASVAPNMLAAMAPNASAYVCTGQYLAGEIWKWMSEWADFHSYCVWVKSNPMPSLHKRHYTWATEIVCYATRGKHAFHFPAEGHTLNVWEIAKNPSNDLHPTMKPVGVPMHAIKHSSNVGDIVLDCFGGAGSTLLACEQSQRVCRIMEISPAYVDVIVMRWEKLTGGKAARV